MTRLAARTMVGRIAWVQTAVTLCALGLVLIGTASGVSALLNRRVDRQLADLLNRTVGYLDQSPAHADIDWAWISSELEESRPRDTRIEVRERNGRQPFVALGTGPSLARFTSGCVDREMLRICAIAGARFVAVAARNRAEEVAARDQLLFGLAMACLFSGAAVALSSRWVTLRTVRPLSELATAVTTIEPGHGQRLQLHSGLQEIDVLAAGFNQLVMRFEDALTREKQFTAHASHELRTPLTVARLEIESLALPHGAPDQCSIGRALSALARLESLVEALLFFAQAQARLSDERMEVVNLADLARTQLQELRRSHPSHSVEAHLPDEALVRGDERLLGRATANLLENAVAHGDATTIVVRLTWQQSALVLSVENGGESIDEAARAQVFLPFFRVNHGSAGFGLGLPFARAVARAHGGDVELDASRANRIEVSLRLPLLAWNDEPPVA